MILLNQIIQQNHQYDIQTNRLITVINTPKAPRAELMAHSSKLTAYRAILIARFSLITVTLICPGYVISVCIF